MLLDMSNDDNALNWSSSKAFEGLLRNSLVLPHLVASRLLFFTTTIVVRLLLFKGRVGLREEVELEQLKIIWRRKLFLRFNCFS